MEEQLWKACSDGNAEDNSTYPFGSTPFYIACENGRIEIVKLLLNDNRVDINKTDNEGKTPFYIACFKGWTEVVKCLLESGREININKANKNDNTPFYSACLYGHIEIVKSLVNDKRIDIKKADIIGKTPFYRVCSEGYIEMVKYMLACGRQIDINKKDDQGKDFERKSDHLKIVELIESFKRNQSENETRTILRIQLGFADANAAFICAMIVLLSDHFLELKTENFEENCVF